MDERMVEMLKNKTRLFDAYARRSAVAESTPDTVDVSDTAMARQIVEEEQARLERSANSPQGKWRVRAVRGAPPQVRIGWQTFRFNV
ncbi:hypothetical protein J7F03_38170 [Streptomyces sp. ISL-43]|nr:hypothetical protein [Streptomyces sp. ISL-43]